MSSLKKAKQNIQANLSMKDLIDVYERVAANTMMKIREQIIKSREYYQGLANLSVRVGSDIANIAQNKNNTKALVLISANEGLYGDITDKVFFSFLKAVKNTDGADILVAGKVGETMMKRFAPKVKYQVLTLVSDDNGELVEILGNKLWTYKAVNIFFGQFHSIAKQEAMNRDLSANELKKFQLDLAEGDIAKLEYIYEPSVEVITAKFSQGIFVGIFRQTLKEDELAKNASRLMHLDSSLVEVNKRLIKNKNHYRKIIKRNSSKKQRLQALGHKMINKTRRSYVY
ncbi:MAG: F0F1 ATP synthase subunit gamma [Candidatus Pacebacteria bacterium]|nr:F0F1 ATP synthase subunit gamma [Candidatus Paceibacterota bacterium]